MGIELSRTERLLLVGGVLAVGAGLVVMAAPGLAGPVGAGEGVLFLFGLLAAIQTVRTAGDYWRRPYVEATLPDVEGVESGSVPGERLDGLLARDGRGARTYRRNVVRYVRHVAVEVLAAETGRSEADVRASLDDGTWTDDPVAAALFTDDIDPSWPDAVRAALGVETAFQRRVRRAVGALERRVGDRDE